MATVRAGDFSLSARGVACSFHAMTAVLLRAALIGVSALLLAGCGSSTSLPHTQAGDPAQQPDFNLLTDIPIPSGATMDNERSLILGDKDRWTGRVVMKLWKSAPDANQFYQSQMPAFGWEPIMAATSGISVMAYVRGDRAATVQIESSAMWGSTVSVIVGHRAATTAPAAAPAAGGGYYDAPRAAPQEKIRSEPLPARR